MTVNANFEDERLLAHIQSSGLLTSFTDPYGNVQGATNGVTTAVNVESIPANERMVFVRLTGNDQLADGSIEFTQYPCTVVVFSKKDLSDMKITRGLASDLGKWLRANYQSDEQCIMSIQVLSSSGSAGPYFEGEGRTSFEIPLLVRFYEVE